MCFKVTLVSAFPLFVITATINRTPKKASWTVLHKIIFITKFNLTNVACERLRVHSVNMQHQLCHPINSICSTIRTSQTPLDVSFLSANTIHYQGVDQNTCCCLTPNFSTIQPTSIPKNNPCNILSSYTYNCA